ncbi:hypothetical protein BGZ63DRAFT_404806 [Mariannaea sp. PMI_226]|nr:hypothetical protein BGZ63DRAFT_404806 [Mariannaea sp. PMI_226]
MKDSAESSLTLRLADAPIPKQFIVWPLMNLTARIAAGMRGYGSKPQTSFDFYGELVRRQREGVFHFQSEGVQLPALGGTHTDTKPSEIIQSRPVANLCLNNPYTKPRLTALWQIPYTSFQKQWGLNIDPGRWSLPPWEIYNESLCSLTKIVKKIILATFLYNWLDDLPEPLQLKRKTTETSDDSVKKVGIAGAAYCTANILILREFLRPAIDESNQIANLTFAASSVLQESRIFAKISHGVYTRGRLKTLVCFLAGFHETVLGISRPILLYPASAIDRAANGLVRSKSSGMLKEYLANYETIIADGPLPLTNVDTLYYKKTRI